MSQKIQITLSKYMSRLFEYTSQKINITLYKFADKMSFYYTKMDIDLKKFMSKQIEYSTEVYNSIVHWLHYIVYIIKNIMKEYDDGSELSDIICEYQMSP